MPDVVTGCAAGAPPDGRGGAATRFGGTEADDGGTSTAAGLAMSGTGAGKI
jgi:hypothetical protein